MITLSFSGQGFTHPLALTLAVLVAASMIPLAIWTHGTLDEKAQLLEKIYIPQRALAVRVLLMTRVDRDLRWLYETLECLLACALSTIGYLASNNLCCYVLVLERFIVLFSSAWREERFLKQERSFAWNAWNTYSA